MSNPTDDLRSSIDSIHALLAEWRIPGNDDRADKQSDGRADDSCVSNLWGSSRRDTKDGKSGQSIDVVAAFALPDAASGGPIKRHPFSTIDHHALLGAGNGEQSRTGGLDIKSEHPAHRLPQPGDNLAGFRIVLELGRGAFARVYLAEEVNLGRRLVAIKVSRPDNDEPWILARLQHAHIVPVHSVCDDASSGLRVLCMPYFGGADLAQVLRAAGGPVPTRHDGETLVKALDQISRRWPDDADVPANHQISHPPRSLASRGGMTDFAQAVSTSRAAQTVPAASRFRWLLSRLVRTGAGSLPPRHGAPLTERDEPSRRFLREASAIEAAVWIVARLAEGLEHAHARGLLHRDLKPSNILLAADGTPMLLDFNLAVSSRIDSPEGEIEHAMIGGTLPYMSPEHLDAFNPSGTTFSSHVDGRSDIYALGLIFFELLAGAPPFPEPPPGTPLLETLHLMIESRRKPPSARARCPLVPWSLDALAAKCITFDPASRYARAHDLAEDLRRFLDNLPMKHCPEPSVRERVGKFARRHPGLFGATSIGLITIVLLGVLGGLLALVYDDMLGLRARVRYRMFDQNYTEIQFLLNTAGRSNEHLKTGIAKAADTLAQLSAETDAPARWGDWVGRLAPEERQRLRERVVELIMLDARARVLLAKESGSEAERRRAIKRAIARLDRTEQIDPAVPSALLAERARYHAALGDFDQARQDRLRSSRITPTTCHDLTLVATGLLSAGDRLGAEQTLKRALCVDITSFWAWFVLGHCHFAQGRFVESAGDFAASSARGPDFAWVHFNRGLALARAGRTLEARHAYDRALCLDPVFSEAFVNRAMVEIELDDLQNAERDLVRSIELGRADLVALTSLGETWARLGRRGQAERYFAGLLARNPSSLVVRVARGFTRIATDPSGARSDFAQALEHDPRHAHALYGMALLERGNDLRKTLEFLQRSLQSDPNLIDAVQLRAFVRARLAEPAALDDVDRLLESPTPHHLYNAACAVAVYAEKAQHPRLTVRALDLLGRAVAAGIPASDAAADPDFGSIRHHPEFRRLFTPTSSQPELRLQ